MWLINYKKLGHWVTPRWLRKPLYLLLLHAATFPLRQLHNRFVNFKNGVFYRLAHNGQVCHLRKVLNDKIDNSQRRIRIVDFDGITGLFVWPDADARDLNITNSLFVWPDSMYTDSGIDFTVLVPAGLLANDAQVSYLKSLVNQYKLAGKNYNIVNF